MVCLVLFFLSFDLTVSEFGVNHPELDLRAILFYLGETNGVIKKPVRVGFISGTVGLKSSETGLRFLMLMCVTGYCFKNKLKQVSCCVEQSVS